MKKKRSQKEVFFKYSINRRQTCPNWGLYQQVMAIENSYTCYMKRTIENISIIAFHKFHKQITQIAVDLKLRQSKNEIRSKDVLPILLNHKETKRFFPPKIILVIAIRTLSRLKKNNMSPAFVSRITWSKLPNKTMIADHPKVFLIQNRSYLEIPLLFWARR